jgi:hypothetical protein
MLLDGGRPLSADVQATDYQYDFRTCYACEPSEFGTVPGAQCAALALLQSLKGDLENHQHLLEREEAEGGELAELRRAARYIMYRKYVAASDGYLGKHVRVRIPLCVIREIRMAFPAPGCNCKGLALAECTQHGYTGHKDSLV